jgi:hypothetical protein
MEHFLKKGILSLVVALAMQNQTPNVRYFPEGVFDEDKKLSAFREERYSEKLSALEEPSLFEASKTIETYRFVWLRTFHHPVSVRLNIVGDGSGALTTKMTGGAGGYHPGKLILSEETKLTKEQVDAFLTQLDKAEFWKLPTNDKELGLDGAQWIIEGNKKGNYHIVDRWSPTDGPVHVLGLYMIQAGKVKVPAKEIY